MKPAKKSRAGKIDVEFTQGLERFSLYWFLNKATLVYGSPMARNRKGVAFDTPDAMLKVAEAMKTMAEKWKNASIEIEEFPLPVKNNMGTKE